MNRVSSKTVPKTPFKLWWQMKLVLRHLHIWGCPTEAIIYNPHERKLDTRTISCHFISYPERSKGYKFYFSNRTTKIMEISWAKFLEDDNRSGSTPPRQNDFEEEHFIIHESFIDLSIDTRNTLQPVIEPIAQPQELHAQPI